MQVQKNIGVLTSKLGESVTHSKEIAIPDVFVASEKPMKILVVIANYGIKNDQYLERLLEEYASMSYDVHCVVLTDIQKNLGPHVEVVVKMPRGNPHSFPFLHKDILAERLSDYDLFIYTEDDTLISERNINAFMDATAVLRDDEIAGFIRTERGPEGEIHFSTIHEHFHWDPASVVSRGSKIFAYFTNQHSACYILTQKQLRRAIESGGFLVESHQGQYDLLESAATDPYTQCGFKKLICISHLEEFRLPHLPNKYVGKLGLRDVELVPQLRSLEAIAAGIRPSKVLLNTDTKLGQFKWSKGYYEAARQDILGMIPAETKHVLSYACGWGKMEAELARKGVRVTAIPLDSVVGACAEARGIEVVYGDSREALAQVSKERFECILATDVLHRFREPEKILESFGKLLAPGGIIVATVPNLSQSSVWWHRIKRDPAYGNLGVFARAGIHLTSCRKIRRWFERASLTVQKVVPVIPERWQPHYRTLGKWSNGLFAEEFIFVAIRSS